MNNVELWNACGNILLVATEFDLKIDQVLSEEYKKQIANVLKFNNADTMMLCSEDGKVVRVLESDMSESNMCGNGIRAVYSYFGFERSFFTTRAGEIECSLIGQDLISVKMGNVNLHGEIDYMGYKLYLSDIGEPHAVLLVDDINQATEIFDRIGFQFVQHFFENYETNFNLNVVQVLDNNNLIQRTFERGVNDETMACGTGASCSFYVLNNLGFCGDSVTFSVKGGNLYVSLGVDNCVYKAGPSVKLKDVII